VKVAAIMGNKHRQIDAFVKEINRLVMDDSISLGILLKTINTEIYKIVRSEQPNPFVCFLVVSHGATKLCGVTPNERTESIESFLQKIENDQATPTYKAFTEGKPYDASDENGFHLAIPIISQPEMPITLVNPVMGVLNLISEHRGIVEKNWKSHLGPFVSLAATAILAKRAVLALHSLQNATREIGLQTDVTPPVILKHVRTHAHNLMNAINIGAAYTAVALLNRRILSFPKEAQSDETNARLQEINHEINLNRDKKTGIVGRAVLEVLKGRSGTLNVGNVHVTQFKRDYISLDLRVRSQIAVVIQSEKQVLGVIDVENDEENAFDIIAQQSLESLANVAAVAIQNASFRQALSRLHYAVPASWNTPHTSTRFLELVLKLCIELAQASDGEFGIVDEVGDVITLNSGEQNRSYSDPNAGDPQVFISEDGKRLKVPFQFGERVVGWIFLGSRVEDAFSPQLQALLRSFANQAVVALWNGRLAANLQRLNQLGTALDKIDFSIDENAIMHIVAEEVFNCVSSIFQISGVPQYGACLLIVKRTEDVYERQPQQQDTHHEQRPHIYLGRRQRSASDPLALDITVLDRKLSDMPITQTLLDDHSIPYSATRDWRTHASSQPALQELRHFRTYIAVPLTVKGKRVGLLAVHATQPDTLNIAEPRQEASDDGDLYDDVRLVHDIADICSGTIGNLLTWSQLRRVQNSSQAIENTLLQLFEQPDPSLDLLAQQREEHQRIWTQIVQIARDLTDADSATIFEVDRERDKLVEVADIGSAPEYASFLEYDLLSAEGGNPEVLSTLVVRDKKELYVPDTSGMNLSYKPMKAVMAVPLRSTSGVIGVLTVKSERRPHAFNKIDLANLLALANQAVLAQQLAYLIASQRGIFDLSHRLIDQQINQTLQLLLDSALKLLKAEERGLYGFIHRLNVADDTLEIFAQPSNIPSDYESLAQFLETPQRIVPDTILGQVAFSGASNKLSDSISHKGIVQGMASQLTVAIRGKSATTDKTLLRNHIPVDKPRVVRGVMTICSRRGELTALDREIMIYFSNLIGMIWSYLRLRDHIHELRKYSERWMSNQPTHWDDLKIDELLQATLDARCGTLLYLSRGQENLEWRTGFGISPEYKKSVYDNGMSLTDGSPGIQPFVARYRKPLNIPDVTLKGAVIHWEGSSQEDYSVQELYVEGAEDTRSELAVPMMRHGQVRGVLNIESPTVHAFDSDDEAFLQTVANLVWSVMAEKENVAAHALKATMQNINTRLHGFNVAPRDMVGLLRNHQTTIEDALKEVSVSQARSFIKQLDHLDNFQRALARIQDNTEHKAEKVYVGDLLKILGDQAPQEEGLNLVIQSDNLSEERPHYFCKVSAYQIVNDVLLELIKNALKYCERPLTVSVTAKYIPSTNMLRIRVADDGQGISIPIDEALRVGVSTGGSSGFGLPRCRVIVEVDCDGDFILRSKLQAGTVVDIFLPTYIPSEEE
jgi:GAF domain-containing protein